MDFNFDTPTEGYVFYTPGFFGQIKGVSYRLSPDFAAYEHITVSADVLNRFLSGEYAVDQWHVGYGDDGVTRVLKTGTIKVDLTPSAQAFHRIEGQSNEAIRIDVKYSTKDHVLMLKLVLDFHGTIPSIECAFDPTFMVTKKGDPSVVYHKLTIPITELLETKIIQLDINDFDIWTTKLNCGYSFTVTDEPLNILPLPMGKFCDLHRFITADVDENAQCVKATVEQHEVVIELQNGGGARYDRKLTNLPVLFTAPGDPTILYHAENIPLTTLIEKGKSTISIPADMVGRKYDIFVPLIFRDLFRTV